MKESASHEPAAVSDASVCPACGEPLSSESPKGLCAACLMLGALDPAMEGDIESAKTVADTSRQAPPEIGDIRAAFPQFEILELIGSGGMGSVYKARQPKLDRIVALKILTAGNRDERFAERFQQEARTLAKLNHPNIVTIHDYGESEGFYFLLMEYIEGLNLRQVMEAGRLAPAQALAIVPPVCEALQFAHDHGIVHRDIKPDNILMNQTGRVKIADFGIARLLGSGGGIEAANNAIGSEDGGSSLTREMILGTPNYMAPEQGTNPEAVDHRADIYSLGVVFYEMLTGERPGSALTPPSERVELDVRLDEVVLRALANQPELRFQSAEEFTRTLAEVTADPPAPGDREPAADVLEPVAGTSKRRPWVTAGAVLLVVLTLWSFRFGAIGILLMALAGGIGFAWSCRRPIPPESAYSRMARALLAAIAVPVVFLVVTALTTLVSPDANRNAAINEPQPPEQRRFTVEDQTIIAVDDGLRTHYVFYFGKNIDSAVGMSQGGSSRQPLQWERSGHLALPSGKRIHYLRESTNLPEITIDGRPRDLRDGAVFEIKADGTVIQHPVYPPLLRDENVKEWLVSTWEKPGDAEAEQARPGFIGAWNSFQDSTYIEFRADGKISIVPVRSAPATGSWIEDPVSGKLMTRLKVYDDQVNGEMEVKMDGKDKASISLDGDAQVYTRLDSTLDAEKFLGTWINSFTNEEEGTVSHYLLIRKNGGKGTYKSLEILNKKEIYCIESGEFEWRMVGDRMVEIFDVNTPEESPSVTYGNFVITPDKITYVVLEDDGDKMKDIRVKAAELPEPPKGFRQVTPKDYWKVVENASE